MEASVMTCRSTRQPRTRILAALLVGLTLALSTTLATPHTVTAAATPGAVYRLEVAETFATAALTVLNQSTADNAPVVTSTDALGQLAGAWRLLDTGAGGGFYQLRNAASGLCLELPGEIAPAGTAAQQYRCDPNYRNQPNQLWQLVPRDSKYVLRNKASGLTLFRTSEGGVIQGSQETPWSFERTTHVNLLCTDTHYGGRCVGSVRTLAGPTLFNDLGPAGVSGRPVWSVLLANTNNAALFSGPDFTGSCTQLTASNADLSATVANFYQLPRPASVMFAKGCPSGLQLCTEAQFGGCAAIPANITNLHQFWGNGRTLGDTTSSLYLQSGLTVALYSDINFEGTCETFTGSDVNLTDNMIGNDRVSSVWLDHRCDQDVQLCEHNDLGGRCVSFRSDKSSLGATDIGNDRASSVRVPAGWQITVFSDENERGWADPFNGPTTRNFGVGSTAAPNDSASSLDIRLRPSTSDACTDRFGCVVQ
jgi:hypothetical protein